MKDNKKDCSRCYAAVYHDDSLFCSLKMKDSCDFSEYAKVVKKDCNFFRLQRKNKK